jgi:hypothetical protein
MATLAAAGLLLGAGIASAQNADVAGRITHIDAANRTVTFSDGRIAHYDPLWRILVNGREVALIDDAPGKVIAFAPAPPATTTAVVPGASQPAMVQVPAGSTVVMTPTPGYAPATVARIDRTTRVVTLSDGRVIELTEVQIEPLQPGAQIYVSGAPAAAGTPRVTIVTAPSPGYAPATVARVDRTKRLVTLSDGRAIEVTEAQIERLQPGSQVYVSTAPPAAGAVAATTVAPKSPVVTTSPSATWPVADREMRGRVVSTDARGMHIQLSDGRMVYVSPAAATRNLSTQPVVVTDVRQGDEVVIQVQEVVPVAGTTEGALHAITVTPVPSLPSYTFPGSALVAPEQVVIVRYPQAA